MEFGQKKQQVRQLKCSLVCCFFAPFHSSYKWGLTAARCSAGSVFLVFFLFPYIVFPLMSAFMLLPACAVAGTKVKPVGIADAVSVINQFSAWIPAEEEHAIVIVEFFPYRETTDMPCMSSPAFEAAIVAFSALSIKHFPNRVFRG